MRRRSLRPFSTFDRYVLREFLRFFLLALTGFVAFVVLFDAFEKIDTFIDNRATASQVLRYYANSIPYKAVLVTPVALLLAAFLSLGFMTRFQEITIMRSSGVSLYRILSPIFGVGLVVAALTFAVTDFVMPGSQTRAREIFNSEIKGRSTRNLGSRMNVSYLGRDNRMFVIRRYDVPNATMIDVVIQEFEKDRLARRLDARKATYLDGAWLLLGGLERTFSPDGGERAARFDSLRLAIPETPGDFAKEDIKPEQMSYPDLKRYVERLRQSGSRVEKLQTDLHLRLSFPLVNFVVLLIGSSLAVRLRRGGIALGFGFSLVIAFAYWTLIRAGQVLGHSGSLPPLAAAWLGNAVFLFIGAYLLYRTPK